MRKLDHTVCDINIHFCVSDIISLSHMLLLQEVKYFKCLNGQSLYVCIYMATLSYWNELKCIFSHYSKTGFFKQCMTDRYQLSLIGELHVNACGVLFASSYLPTVEKCEASVNE